MSGVLGSDNINVVARYQEADNTRNSNSGNYFDFSKYVNDVYKDADGTFKKASAGKYFKKLVFTMTVRMRQTIRSTFTIRPQKAATSIAKATVRRLQYKA